MSALPVTAGSPYAVLRPRAAVLAVLRDLADEAGSRVVRVSRHDLVELTGASESTVGRVLRQLRAEHLITTRQLLDGSRYAALEVTLLPPPAETR